ncbi:ShKT domain-containing protein [Caenorhabditis elegans]|uniref:ShKT domain-containing protein n=1 Tax=Caenorhabditis elegans TaxID=6239 RepID=Q9XXC6_CAEEL|nr:ShKT domain-containing protein [Caenorhabditis elegans]CAA19536.2 ShKT domain-containing protein [Caenorhabditis elegans]
MIKHLTIFFILAASTSAQQVVSCRVSFTGPAFGGVCPAGNTEVSSGDCCPTAQVVNGTITCNGGLVGPSIGGLCPAGSSLTTARDCCNNANIVITTPCVDVYPRCAHYQKCCANPQFEAKMRANCALTCKFCTPTPNNG